MKTIMNSSRKKRPIVVRLEFHDDQAKTVCIAGTFNDWHPKTTAMLVAGPGRWIKELALSPGSYEYQYVVDGRWINDPQAVKSAPNPFGGRNSVLVVERNNTKSGTTSQPVGPVRNTAGENRRQS